MVSYQLRALIWRNFLIRFRNRFFIILELGFPVLFCALVEVIFLLSPTYFKEEHVFPSRPVEDFTRNHVNGLLYLPDTTATAKLMRDGAGQEMPKPYPIKHPKDKYGHPVVYLEFSDESEVPKHLKFQIITTNYDDHYASGVHYLQYVMTKMFINYWQKQPSYQGSPPNERFYIQMMPVPRGHVSLRGVVLRHLEMALPYLFIGLVCSTALCIVKDKESRKKGFFKMFDVRTSTYYLSWLVTSLAIGLCTCLAVAVVLCVDKDQRGAIVFRNPVLILSFLGVYLLDVISFSFLVSCLVNKARNAVLISGVVFALTRYSAPHLQRYIKSPHLSHATASVFFHTGSLLFDILFHYERQEKYMTMYRMRVAYDVVPHLTALDALAMLVTNAVVNLAVVWFVENTSVVDYTTPWPYWFPFMMKYWMRSKKSSAYFPILLLHNEHSSEQPAVEMTAAIQIRNLVKVFDGPVVILGTDLDIYQDNVTVLVGPEGAGKTTVINMLAGLLPATGGTAFIDGYDNHYLLSEARYCMGVCPQHDVVFDQLTCWENLIFYSMLRTRGSANTDQDVDDLNREENIKKEEDLSKLLQEFGLDGNVACGSLSGYDKRKLSIACSFVGDSRIILLDEPFHGLDPATRRDVQKLLRDKKDGRTVLLTTEHIDEALEAGDRMAIMSRGQVKAYGTLSYLKKLYGIGYHINIFPEADTDVNEITKAVSDILPEALIQIQNETEIEVTVVEDRANLFPALFQELESKQSSKKISKVTLTSSWIKDVYTRVGSGLDAKLYGESEVSEMPDSKTGGSIGTSHRESEGKHSWAEQIQPNKLDDAIHHKVNLTLHFHHTRHFQLFLHQVKAIFYMKTILFIRGRLCSLLQLSLPFVLTVAGLAADSYSAQQPNPTDPLYFSPSLFKTDLIYPVFYEMWDPAKLVMTYIKEIQESYGSIEEYKYSTLSYNGTLEDFAVSQLLSWANEYTTPLYNEFVQFGLLKYFHNAYVIVYYRNSTNHSAGIAMQLAMNAWVKCSLGDDFSVQTGVQYFPRPFEDLTDRFPRKWTTFYLLALSMAIVPLPFMYSLVLERATGAKQLESLSGTRPYDYWRGHFAFDIIIYNLVVTPVLIVLLLSGLEKDQTWLTLIIFAVYGFTMFTYLYALQFFFLKPLAAVVFLFLMNIIIGVVLSAYVVSSSLKGQTTQNFTYFIGVTISVLNPNFVLTGFIYLLTLQPSSFVFPVVTRPNDAGVFFCVPINYIYYLLCQMFFSWLIVAFFEFTLDRRLGDLMNAVSADDDSPIDFIADADVQEEVERIEHAHKSELIRTYSIVLKGLTKQYHVRGKYFTAVSNLSVGLSEKDCLGLLGPRGAGKTTVCQMVTGEIGITSGQVFMHGLNTRKHFKRTQSMIGYCPQHDELPVQLTGREALYMFARLRGVPSDVIHQVVNDVIDLATLSPYEDQLIKNYSLGFKRRASVAAAIIGAPRFILLDEPTEGLDPTAKQIIWTVLQNVRAAGKTLIVASRSIEECEALCTHVAVMVKGHVVSFGSPEHLKLKYNRGHSVKLYASASEMSAGPATSLERAQEYVLGMFVNTKVFARSNSYVELFVPETVKLSVLFEMLEAGKTSSYFQSYRVQQISYEQILLRFMKTD